MKELFRPINLPGGLYKAEFRANMASIAGLRELHVSQMPDVTEVCRPANIYAHAA